MTILTLFVSRAKASSMDARSSIWAALISGTFIRGSGNVNAGWHEFGLLLFWWHSSVDMALLRPWQSPLSPEWTRPCPVIKDPSFICRSDKVLLSAPSWADPKFNCFGGSELAKLDTGWHILIMAFGPSTQVSVFVSRHSFAFRKETERGHTVAFVRGIIRLTGPTDKRWSGIRLVLADCET